jgi:hypothetical protein
VARGHPRSIVARLAQPRRATGAASRLQAIWRRFYRG